MGPRADISIYDIDICIWGRALIYEQSATLSCRDIPVGQIELFELFEQIELSGLVPCMLTWSVLVILRTGDRSSNHVTRF